MPAEIDLDRVVIPGNRLLVRQVAPETTSPGGIILPDVARADRRIATVVKLGTAWTASTPSEWYALELDVGDEVITARYAMESMEAEELGPNLRIINFDAVEAVVKPKKGATDAESEHRTDPAQ